MSTYEIEIERGYLYALMLSPHAGLTNDFMRPWLLDPSELTGTRQKVMQAALRAIESGGSPDFSGICAEVDTNIEALEEVLECAMPRMVTLGQGFSAIREARLRETRKATLILAADRESRGERVDADELAESLRKSLTSSDIDSYTPEKLAVIAFERVAKLGDGGKDTRIKLGVQAVDREFGGLDVGGLTTIGARPSVGKSALSLFLAITSPARSVVVSCEDPVETWAGRYASSESGVNASSLRSGELTPEECSRLGYAVERSKGKRFGLLNMAGKTIQEVEQGIEKYARKMNPQIIIVDYAQSISDPKSRDERERIDRVINGLKALGGRCEAHVILMSQLRRVDDDTIEPGVQDLKASGRFEEASENIILMWRNAQKTVMARIAKNKSGKTGGLFVLNQSRETAAFTGIHECTNDPSETITKRGRR